MDICGSPGPTDFMHQRFCVLKNNASDIAEQAKGFGLPVIIGDTSEALNLLKKSHFTIYIMKEFEGNLFMEIQKSENWILGPTALLELAGKKEPLQVKPRPVYCWFMKDQVFYLGMKGEHKVKLAACIRYMGGSVRKEVDKCTTYMIADSCMTPGYFYAHSFNVPIMTSIWVEQAWENRDVLHFKTNSEEMMQYKLKPFSGLFVCLLVTELHVKKLIFPFTENGGEIVQLIDPRCTHVVAEESDFNTFQTIEKIPEKCKIVSSEWFAVSIQNNCRAVDKEYLNKKAHSSYKNKMRSSLSMPEQRTQYLEKTASSLQNCKPDTGTNYSLERCSTTARHNTYLELLYTEDNYVKILETILQMHNLSQVYSNMAAHYSISMKCLEQCEMDNPRFQQLLTEWKCKPQCYRQYLKELLIRPIQRLGSCILILREIRNNTPTGYEDHKKIEIAIIELEKIMASMNDGNERTEKLCTVFDIYNLIENCPADLIASHRHFLIKFSGQELCDGLSNKADHVVFFVFTDVVEACRVKNKVVTMSKTNATSEKLMKLKYGKPYKHIKVIPFYALKRVIRFQDTDTVKNSFGLKYRDHHDLREKTFCFRYLDHHPSIGTILMQIARQKANLQCRLSADDYLYNVHPSSVGLKTSDISSCSVPVAAQLALKTQMFVSNTFGSPKCHLLGQDTLKRVTKKTSTKNTNLRKSLSYDNINKRIDDQQDETHGIKVESLNPNTLTLN